MTPLKLSITGFGPYREEQIIDFTSMGETPLFLINGPTGAGKTTILDAICYALYDRATWKSRDVKDMRCHHCTLDDRTIVTLDFMVRGERFRVEREPEYERRARKKKTGATDEVAINQKSAKIYRVAYTDGKESLEALVQNKGKVTDKVVELLGLDAEQFCQVIVLPQGMTRELLTEKSSDRERIYETLFNTGIYVAIERELKQRKEDIDQQTGALTFKATQLLEKAGVTTKEELIVLVTDLEERLGATEAEQVRLRKALDAAREKKTRALSENRALDEIAQAEVSLAQLAAQQPQIDILSAALEQHAAAEPLKPIHEAYQRILTELPQKEADELDVARDIETLGNELADCEVADEAASNTASGRDKLLSQRASLEAVIESFSRLDTANEELKDALAAEQAAQAKLAEAESWVSRLDHEHQIAAQDVTARQEEVHRIPNFAARKLKLEAIERLQEAESNAQIEIDDAERQVKFYEAVYADRAATYEGDNAEFLRLQKAWHLEQAAILAVHLEDKAPCPVCGSHEHPSLATMADENISSAMLENARKAAESSLGAKRAEEANIENAKTALQKANAKYEDAAAEAERENLDDIDVTQALAELEIQRIAAETAEEELQSAIDARDAKKTELDESVEIWNSAKDVYSNAASTVKLKQQVAESITINLPAGVENIDALRVQIQGLTEQVSTMDKAVQAAAQALASVKQKYAAAEAKAELAAQEVEEARLAKNEAENAWEEALEGSVFEAEGAWKKALMSPEFEKEKRASISNHREDIAELQGVIRGHRKTLEGVENRHDLESLEQLVSESQKAVEDVSQAVDSVRLEHQLMVDRLNEFTHNQSELDRLNEKFGPIDELYRLASGSASGRISLHRHIQGKLLDEVVARGNLHYRQMTNGRYVLKRRTTSSGRGGHDGLALNIFDAQSATERSVSTLSGGESFQAQTALALGLSEAVQAHAGGVQLETLFIDEGFGSLDADSLQLVIETLMELQASGRSVGVISHVDSMNAQIDTQITVVNGKSGSRLSVIV